MENFYIEADNLSKLKDAFNKIDKDLDYKSIMIYMADQNKYDESVMNPLLIACNKNIVGGVFPEIIFRGERKSEGIIFMPIVESINPLIVDVSSEVDQQKSIDDFDDRFCEWGLANGTILTYVDAFAEGKTIFIEALFNYFGVNVSYLGGGAGSLSFKQSNSVITNKGMLCDVAIIGNVKHKHNIGVAHGWKEISRAYKVTKADGNIIKEIDWRPAFDVYKETVEAHAKKKFNDDNFFDIAKSYPLGVTKIDAESVIRDPFMADGDNLVIVDRVNEGEHIHIMHGDMDSLLEGAQKAVNVLETEDGANKLCIDCISRVLFMNEEFEKELNIISQDGCVNGILSIGEIANSGESFLEIYNKTIVITKW